MVYLDYQMAIAQKLKELEEAGNLSFRLLNPTPAYLKKECIEVCKERFDNRDRLVLEAFFGRNTDKEAFLQAIDLHPTPKYKALANYFKEKTENPDRKIVEMVAWLIDFQPRPWEEARKKVFEEPPPPPPPPIVVPPPENDPPTVIPDPDREKTNGKKWWTQWRSLVGFVIVLLVGTSVLLGWKLMSKTSLTGNESCMYWNVDHYEPVSCSANFGDTLVVGLDSARLRDFKRITTPDTITYNSLGRVWYIKRNGQLEFYTSNGKHPVDPNLKLRPITVYIINKYILKNAD